MEAKIVSSEALCKVKGSETSKLKFLIELNGKYYFALFWYGLENPIVYDENQDEYLKEFNWFVMQVGYAYNKIEYMHRHIMKRYGQINVELSVDHINECKLDNRVENLRLVSQSVQNSNRKSRCDKIKPSQELIDIGITELPKYVRWADTEKKFVIEKHPYLVKEVKSGVRKKPFISGTKASTLSITNKFEDILARLQELDDKNIEDKDNNDVFQQSKKRLRDEYEAIKCCILHKMNIEYTPTSITCVPNYENLNIERNTLPGRKKKSTLPEDCGVDAKDIPSYCHYRPASKSRGDFFVIDIPHQKPWYSTSSRSTTTLEKYNKMIEIYDVMRGITSSELDSSS